MIADLHTHTTASDGTYSPEKLVKAAQRKKINVLSVTDHDTVAGLPQIEDLCKKAGIIFIPGIEITCHAQEEEIHILAYGVNTSSPTLQKFLDQQLQDRYSRLEKIIEQLEAANVFLTWEEVKRHIHSESAAGRPHVARALVYKGYVPTFQDAFTNYLTPGKPGYVPRKKIPADAVIALIHQTGGISSLAHPGFIKKQEILEELASQGLQGIEAYHPMHKTRQKTQYERWAEEKNLLVTGGSDFHGDKKRGHGSLGSMKIPPLHIENLLARVN